MRKKRQWTMFLIVLLAVMNSMIFASGQNDDAEKEIVLEYWVYSDFAQGKALELQMAFIEEFEAANPGVNILISGKGDQELTTGQITGAASGNLPDVFMNSTAIGAQLVQVGALKNIHDDWMNMPEEFRGQFNPKLIDMVTPEEGIMYGMPYTGFASFMFRNLTVLEAAGIDPDEPIDDWEEWLEQMKKVSDAGYIAMADMALHYWSIATIYSGIAGRDEWGADFARNKTRIDPVKYAQTAEFLSKVKPYSTNLGVFDQGVTDLFISNQLAFNLNGPWIYPLLESVEEQVDLNYDWILVPGAEKGLHGGVEGYEFIGVAPNQHADLAWKFAAYVCEKDQMYRWASALGRYNSNRAALDMIEHPLLDITSKASEYTILNKPPFFVAPYPNNFWLHMTDNMTSIVDGEMAPMAGAEELVNILNSTLAQ